MGSLEVAFEDISGGQWIGRASFENLLGDRWSFGSAVNVAMVDVDWKGLKDNDGNSHLDGSIDMSTNDICLCPG